MSDARAKVLLDQLYAELPRLDCKRECHSSCGPIAMSRVEWARITKRLRCEPVATGIVCPMLVNNLCSVYTIRPMLCRLWGIIETMKCPWGCVPDPGWLTAAEGYDFLLRADMLSEPEHAEQYEELRRRLHEKPALVDLSAMLHVPPQMT